MSAIPFLTPDERRENLAKAVAARRQRSEIKSALLRGEILWSEVLDSKDLVIGKMRTLELISSLPGIGPVRAKQIMDQCGISSARRVAGLGVHQRQKLREALKNK
jgi:transposase